MVEIAPGFARIVGGGLDHDGEYAVLYISHNRQTTQALCKIILTIMENIVVTQS
jgi:hypothetical protein